MKRLMVISLIALAACGPTREQLNAQDDGLCRSYGLSFGTPQYAQCRACSLSSSATLTQRLPTRSC